MAKTPLELAVTRFIELYQTLDKTQLHRLPEIYHSQINFQDPLHAIQGLPALNRYFDTMYANVMHIEFEIKRTVLAADTSLQATLEWQMRFKHRRLKQGKTITVDGMSWLSFSKENAKEPDLKVIAHRDYFDAGQMLYEQLPLLGQAVRYLKQRIAEH